MSRFIGRIFKMLRIGGSQLIWENKSSGRGDKVRILSRL